MFLSDPTYLRFLVDSLSSGAVQKDNANSLPFGLVGIYEEALSLESNVKERKKLLEFFCVWALLKKEVSSEFVCKLLNEWDEEDVALYIGNFSKWFNSPVSGHYSLYHERLRTFIMQKMDNDQLKSINQQIIDQSNIALKSKSGDEWERYALEFLSSHLLIEAMEGKEQAQTFKSLSYSISHWNRQIEVSKGFEWSKRMLNEMMLWASKYDDEQVIECALNKVDLFHMEQNDAPRIVELVAQNEIETALQRIESFGGNDDKGIQRKFLLYMLCLMELTLLDSKNEKFSNSAIEYLLKHLSENLEAEVISQNLNEFFPEHLLYEVIKCIEEKGLNSNTLVNCSFTDYIDEYKSNSKFKNNLALIQNISFIQIRVFLYVEFIKKLRAADKLKSAKNVFWHLSGTIKDIPSTFEKALIIIHISSLFNEYFLDDESFGLVTSLEECKYQLDTEQLKYLEYKQGQTDPDILLGLADKLTNPYNKILVYCDIIRSRLQLTGSINLSDLINKVSDLSFTSGFYLIENILIESIFNNHPNIFFNFSKSLEITWLDENTGELLTRDKLFKDLLTLIYVESNKDFKYYYNIMIQYNFGVKNMFEIEQIMAKVTGGYLKLNKVNQATAISKYSSNLLILKEVYCLLKENYINEIREFFNQYIPLYKKIKEGDVRYSNAELSEILLYYLKLYKQDEYQIFWNEAINSAEIFKTADSKCFAFIDIAKELVLLNDFVSSELFLQKAYQFSKDIDYVGNKINCYLLISDLLYTIEKRDESQRILIEASEIDRDSLIKEDKCLTLIKISSQYYKLEKFENADIYLQQALVEARDIAEDEYGLYEKCKALCIISVELARSYRVEHLYKVIDDISNSCQYIKEKPYINWALNSLVEAYSKIIEDFFYKDKIYEAINFIKGVGSIKIKEQLLKKISLEFTKINKLQEALSITETISNITIQDSSFNEIGVYLISNMSYSKTIDILNNIENIRIRNIIMKGVVNNLTPSNVDFEKFTDELKNYVNDELTLEHILIQYFLKQFFYNNLNENTIHRFNSTLNLKWAIDIKNNI